MSVKIIPILLALSCSAAFAGQPIGISKDVKAVAIPDSRITPYLFTEAAYVGSGDIDQGGEGSSVETRLQLGITKNLPQCSWPNYADGGWRFRLGAEWHRFDFDNDANLPIPNTLQSVSAVIALEYIVDRQRVILLEAKPGLYFEHDPSWGAFNVPVKLGMAYEINESFAVVAGLSYDAFLDSPFIPVIGFNWKITPALTLRAVPPDPRLQWQVSETTALWLGGEFAGGGYRVDDGREGKLREAVISYTDYRGAIGTTWRPCNNVEIEAALGASFYRKWDYHRAEVGYKTDEIAPFAKLSINAWF